MKKRSRIVALGGIFSAICIISLYIAVYMPTNRLFFYSLSSIFVSFIIMESGVKGGWLFYIATSSLSMLLIPNKISLIPYLIFFGIYGIIKYYIESMNKLLIEIILKGIFFLTSEVAIYILYTKVFGMVISSKIPVYWVFGVFVLIFYVYDYVYTKIISYYTARFKRS